MISIVTDDGVKRLKLKGKPKCLACGRPLSFIFEGSTGIVGEKCKKCGQEYLVNTETLEVIKVNKVS